MWAWRTQIYLHGQSEKLAPPTSGSWDRRTLEERKRNPPRGCLCRRRCPRIQTTLSMATGPKNPTPGDTPSPRWEGGDIVYLQNMQKSLKSSTCEITPQFPGQFRSQYSKSPNTLSNADITSPEKGQGAGFRSQPAESSLLHLHLSSPALHS